MEHNPEIPERECKPWQQFTGMDNRQRETLLGFLQMKGAIETMLWIHVHGGVHMSEMFNKAPEVMGAGMLDGYLHVDDQGDVQLTEKGAVIAERLMGVFA